MDNNTPQPIPPEDWPPELAHIIEDMNGNPINVHRLMANSPGLLNAWWSFRNYSVNGGSLGPRKIELVILRVAVHLQSWYEWGSHVDRAMRCGIEVDEIFGILQSVLMRKWAEEDRSLLMAVDELTEHRKIQPITLAILHKHYSNKQVMDLIAIHGMYMILGSMIKTWGLELDTQTLTRISGVTDKKTFMEMSETFLDG